MRQIFEDVRIGNLKLKNRIVRAATWENLADDDGCMTEKLFGIYEELARGGVGMIVTGYAFVTEDEQPNPGMMGAAHDRVIEGYQRLTQMVQAHDCRIVMQIAYGGAQTGYRPEGRRIWGPSDVADLTFGVEPTPITREEIKSLVNLYGDAADRVKKSGFDGVEIHAAHGYFLSQFLTPYYNRRDDEYGGSVENRTRILVEIYEEIRRRVGDFPIFLRFNADDFVEEGLTFEESRYVARRFDALRIDLLDISGGNFASGDENPCRQKITGPEKEAYHAAYAAKIAEEVSVPVAVAGGIRTLGVMDNLLETSQLELFSLSRPLLAEPDLPNRWQHGDTSPVVCGSCNYCLSTRPAGSYPCLRRPYPDMTNPA